MVPQTYFVGVTYQSREAPDLTTRFIQNTCHPSNRRTVGAIDVQSAFFGRPHNQQFDATIRCDVIVNEAADGTGIIITSARPPTQVNISLDGKLRQRDMCVLCLVFFHGIQCALVLSCRWPVPISGPCVYRTVWIQLQCDCAG